MPHLTLEYSGNLDADMPALCVAHHRTLLDSGLFEIGAPRVRALRATAWAIADLDPDNAFVDMVLRVGQGRSAADLRALGDALIASVTACLPVQMAGNHFALSLEIREIDGAQSWKRNTMHARLRAKG